MIRLIYIFIICMSSILNATMMPIPRCFSEDESDLEVKEMLSNMSGYRYILQAKHIILAKLFEGRGDSYITDIINSPRCNKRDNILTIDYLMSCEHVINTDYLLDDIVCLDIYVKEGELLNIIGSKPLIYHGNMTINGNAYFGTEVDGCGSLTINKTGYVKTAHNIKLAQINSKGILEFYVNGHN